MRLTSNQIAVIKETAQKYFGGNSKVFLFGSRTDDGKKGGDIDLYIETDRKKDLFQQKIKMLQKLYESLGEKK